MSAPADPLLPSVDAQLIRRRLLLQWACALLLAGAAALLLLPLGKVPWAARIFTAATDIIMAGFLGVLLRQKFPKSGAR